MKTEYKTALIALLTTIKPCCVMMWGVAFFGAGVGVFARYLSQMRLTLFITGLICILYSLWRIGTSFLWCAKNRKMANWHLAILNAGMVAIATCFYIYSFAHSPLFD
jgi:chromate transport protein ChrA